MKINHLDLFSGVGGFSLALQRAVGEENIGWTGYSDIDKYANQVFKRRFKDAEELGSVVDIDTGKLPGIDLVTFGFPCQDLSIAGKRGGLQANRSGLFFEAMRIIGAAKPKYIIFENVKGLFSSNGGKDFDIILRTIAEFGYDGQWQLCNTRWFLPQNRERIYFVGHLRGECRPKVFPIEENGREDRSSREQTRKAMISAAPSREYGFKDISPTLCARDYKDPKLVVIGKKGNKKNNQDYASCLAGGGHSGGNHSDMDLIRFKVHCTQQRGGMYGQSTRWGVYNEDGLSPTLVSAMGEGGGHIPMINTSNIRRLTPTECSRLQGFPDDWNEGQSDTQRYKQMGNAITVNVAEAIFRKLYKEIT